jgi:hypothetical protein
LGEFINQKHVFVKGTENCAVRLSNARMREEKAVKVLEQAVSGAKNGMGWPHSA